MFAKFVCANCAMATWVSVRKMDETQKSLKISKPKKCAHCGRSQSASLDLVGASFELPADAKVGEAW